MRWEQVTLIDGGRRITGEDARRHAAQRFPEVIHRTLKKMVVFNRQACAKYFGSGHASGSQLVTDETTVRAVLRALFGASVELPPLPQDPAPPRADVQRARPNVVRRVPPVLRMYLDADRDGAVDAEPPDHAAWTWGADGYGGIIVPVTRAWAGADVVAERVPLEFDWQHGTGVDWQATLAVDVPDRIRIYRGATAADELVLGQGRPGPLDLRADGAIGADLTAPRRVRLWMDVPDYPLSQVEADWLVRLTLTFDEAGYHSVQRAVLRIAPWIMSSDLEPTAVVFMRDILADDLVRDVGRDYRLIETQTRARHVNTVTAWIAAQAALPTTVYRQRLAANSDEKGFMRDVMKFGYTTSPRHNRIVFLLDLEAQSPLMTLPSTLHNADTAIAGIQRPQNLAADGRAGQDNGGNYLVTPRRPGYEYGRIIFGDGDPPGLCHAGPFLQAQRIQNPIVLDSTWLDVGHVDEFLSFVPDYSDTADPTKPFKVLIASPRLAYLMMWATARQLGQGAGADIDLAILHAQQKSADCYDAPLAYDAPTLRLDPRFAAMTQSAGPDVPAHIGYRTALDLAPPVPAGADGKCVYTTNFVHLRRLAERLWPGQDTRAVRYTPDGGTTFTPSRNMLQSALVEVAKDISLQLVALAADWREALEVTQPVLNAARNTLKAELGLVDGDFIEVPVMLHYSEDHKGFFDAPDAVNLLALNDPQAETCTCLVPKPYGPVLQGQYVFEKYLGDQLGALGLTVHFVNDTPFSINHGEVHCGTNQRPMPLTNPAWWRYRPPSIA